MVGIKMILVSGAARVGAAFAAAPPSAPGAPPSCRLCGAPLTVSKDDLVGHYAFEMFDTTLPSERRQQAQTLLEELLTPMLQNPQIGALFGFDVRKLMLYILKLQGIKNPEQFAVTPQPELLQPQPPPSNGQPQSNGSPLNSNGRATTPGVSGSVPEPVASGNYGEA